MASAPKRKSREWASVPGREKADLSSAMFAHKGMQRNASAACPGACWCLAHPLCPRDSIHRSCFGGDWSGWTVAGMLLVPRVSVLWPRTDGSVVSSSSSAVLQVSSRTRLVQTGAVCCSASAWKCAERNRRNFSDIQIWRLLYSK